MKRPIGIDLFAGAGGMSLGFEQAGFDVVAAVESDPVHGTVHKFNFPNCSTIVRDVSQVTASELRERAKIGSRTVDCVFGGPPCQGFSLIGYRTLEDPRNALVLEFVRLVSELDAQTFVFENVKGLTVGRHRTFLSELVHAFNSVGYEVRLPWSILDAASFGVPQRRERLILMGAKKGCSLPEYPTRLTARADKTEFELPSGPSCADALGDIPDAERYADLREKDDVPTDRWGKSSNYAQEMRCETDEAWHFGYKRNWNRSILTSSMRTEHTIISRRRFHETKPGTVEPISRFYRLSPNGISNTLRAGTDGARGAFTSPRPIHYKFARCITVREMARLHGFPDWFRFHATKWHGARQVGNAVPPPLARAVAVQIVNALGIVGVRPDKAISLGSGELLRMDMSAAAQYFEVPPLMSRRDRKSGLRKRSQAEIEAIRIHALEALRG